MNTTTVTDTEADQFCSTTYAARILRLSVGTVQKLVETKKLKAWRTEGGHRRISMRSIMAYQKALGSVVLQDAEPKEIKRVLIVEDDENTRKMYETHFGEWDLQIDVVIYSSAIQALMDMYSLAPSVLLTDLQMENMNGFEFIKTIRSNGVFQSLPIFAITGLSDADIEIHGGLGDDIFIIKKPVDMAWLKGLLQGVLAIN